MDCLFLAQQLIFWAEKNNIALDDSVMNSNMDGFGNSLEGKDRFDALIGLYGMINVVLEYHHACEPYHPQISKVECGYSARGDHKR